MSDITQESIEPSQQEFDEHQRAESQEDATSSQSDAMGDVPRASKIEFHRLTEATAVAILIRQGTQVRYVNSAAEAITGYTRTELLAVDFWDLVHPEFQALARKWGRTRQRGEAESLQYEIKILTKNKEDRWLDVTLGVIEFEGKPAELVTAFDITERVWMAEALRMSEAKNLALLKAMPDMMFRVRKDGTLLEFKPAHGLEPFLPPSEFLGRKITAVLPGEVAQQSMHYIRRTLETGVTQEFEYSLLEKGAMHHYEARLVVSGVQADEVLAIVRDITQRKRREAAVEAERARIARDLYDGLAHSLLSLGLQLDYRRTQATPEPENVAGGVHAPKEMAQTDTLRQFEQIKDPPTTPVTQLELEILRLIAQGLSNSDIGHQLGLAEKTIGNRLTAIFDKLHVDNRTQAAMYALRQGWASLDERDE